MWSAIPVALLCMIVILSERKQGSGPEGDEVLKNTGDFRSFVCLFVRLFVPPSLGPSGLKYGHWDLKSGLSGLKSSLSGLKSSLSGLKSSLSGFKLGLSGL